MIVARTVTANRGPRTAGRGPRPVTVTVTVTASTVDFAHTIPGGPLTHVIAQLLDHFAVSAYTFTVV